MKGLLLPSWKQNFSFPLLFCFLLHKCMRVLFIVFLAFISMIIHAKQYIYIYIFFSFFSAFSFGFTIFIILRLQVWKPLKIKLKSELYLNPPTQKTNLPNFHRYCFTWSQRLPIGMNCFQSKSCIFHSTG